MDNEDLTASHWDDVLSPNEFSTTNNDNNGGNNLHQSILPPLTSQFNRIHIDDPFASPFSNNEQQQEDEEEEEEEEEQQQQQSERYQTFDSPSPFYDSNQAEQDQRQELKKEQRKEHKHQLLSELTHGSENSELMLESSVIPEDISTSESLFQDKGSPIKVVRDPKQEVLSSPSKTTNFKQGQFKASRPRKFSAKLNVQHLSNNNQLGPLGVSEDEQNKSNDGTSSSSTADSLVKQADAPLYSIPRKATTVETSSTTEGTITDSPIKRKPIKEPDNLVNNKLDISVGDPMKVGDITTAHIVYTIKTINRNLQSENFSKNDTTEVARRYRDFRWIYHQLQNNHPGKIIPPPPTKQTYIGRFNENFIENRRLSLEKMLNRISHIPVLCNDPDFVMFLTSDDFVNESRERERLSGSAASTQNSEYLDRSGAQAGDVESSTGSLTPISTGSTTTGGFMSSLFSISNKVNEPDEYFTEQKQYIEDLEFNLKQFYKAIELIGTQRIDLIGILEEISMTIDELANLEISKITSDLLLGFSEIQLKIRDNLDRINLQDQLTLGFTIEEYLRIIGSIKFVFDTRIKIYQQYYNFNQELLKKQNQLEKLHRKSSRSAPQVDKLNQLSFEVDKLKQKTTSYELNFNQISETIKQELENFEFERIDDFRNSVEIFIESSIESQKEAIELYETFYERQKLASV